jgi:hypothetical protein
MTSKGPETLGSAEIGLSEADVRSYLLERYGLVIGGKDLLRILAFPTAAAFQKAVNRGTIGVETFFIRGRKGRFAHTEAVARWFVTAPHAGPLRMPATDRK